MVAHSVSKKDAKYLKTISDKLKSYDLIIMRILFSEMESKNTRLCRTLGPATHCSKGSAESSIAADLIRTFHLEKIIIFM